MPKTPLPLKYQWLTLRKEKSRLPNQPTKNVLCYANIILCLLVTLSGHVALATQEVEPTGEKGEEVFVPGRPVTNESVEAGLLKRRNALRSSPGFLENDAPTHLRLAEVLSQQGDPNGAIEEYRAAKQLDPDLAGAFLGMGAVYLDQHEWKQAENALERAAQLDSENSPVEYWLGRSRLAQQKFYDAQHAFRTATRLNPDDAEAFSDIGLTYLAQGQSREAINALRQAIRLRPDFSEAHSRLELAEAFTLNEDQLVLETAKILQILFRRE